ncbi:hypothetical protein KKG31_00525 [Patescibacteria group bacterium]|nr:hypothetical protein [Patescibacteria group bacterium]MBU1757672.1 hypothetical protein [Patescibacteria group bacterium]
MKNCYMVFDTGMAEDSLYSVRVAQVKRIADGFEIQDSENVYNSINIHNSRNMFYAQDCYDCSYSAFLYNCRGCHNCIGCSNLINQSYCVFNKKVSKEEYGQMWSELFDGTRTSVEKFRKLFENIK